MIKVKIVTSPILEAIIHLRELEDMQAKLSMSAPLVSERFVKSLNLAQWLYIEKKKDKDFWEKLLLMAIEEPEKLPHYEDLVEIGNWFLLTNRNIELKKLIIDMEQMEKQVLSDFEIACNKILGIKVPEIDSYLGLSYSYDPIFSMGRNYGKVCYLIIRFSNTPKAVWDVFLHEILHTFVHRDENLEKKIKTTFKKIGISEKETNSLEVFNCLLVPHGIISDYCGLETFDYEKLLRSAECRDNVYKGLLNFRDLSFFEEYDYKNPRETIFEFLLRNQKMMVVKAKKQDNVPKMLP